MIKVRPIIPGKLTMFAPKRHREAIERTMRMGEERAKAEIASLTKNWSSPVAVEVRTQGDLTLILVADARWIYNDEGTKAHVIRPKRAKVLHFVTKAGSEVFAKKVNHPGTKAQYLNKKVQRAVDASNLAQTFTNLVGGL